VRSVDPSRARVVRVLVAEAAQPPVPLSGILEAAGLRVVGRAATPAELERLLPVTRPEVVVFDGEMSAQTVATTRSADPDVGIVLVWPEGAVAGTANQHVAPAQVRRDLAAAVRRAAPLLRVGSAPAPAHPIQAAPAPVTSEKRRRGVLELLVAAVLTFLLVLSSIIFRITEGGGGGTIAQGPGASLLPAPSGNPSGERVALPEAPSNVSTETATLSVNARIAPLLPVTGSGPDDGGGGGGGNGGGGNGGGGGGGGGGNGGGGNGGGGNGGGGGGGGGNGGGGLADRAAACNAAVDADLAPSVLNNAIARVLENCLKNTKSTGLPFALAHLAANAHRRAEHDGTGTGSGHRAHDAPGPHAHGGSNDHGPGSGHGGPGEHGNPNA
jgi:hypothetical protein